MSVVQNTEETAHTVAQLGQGKVGSNSHPIHPSTVHFPIGLLSFSFALDALTLAHMKAPSLLAVIPFASWMLPSSAAAQLVSHYACAAGLLAAVPTVISGLAELYEMWRMQAVEKGNTETAKQTLAGQQEKLWTTLRHAAIMDSTLLFAAYNWFSRRSSGSDYVSLPTLVQSPTNLFLSSLLGVPMILYGAYLGGDLVYRLGVGIQRQGSALEKKQEL